MFDKEMYQETFSKVTASEETCWRVMNMAKERKGNKGRKYLARAAAIAAVISVLAVTASASEVVRDWFASYITKGNEEIINEEQATFIKENEQKFHQSVIADGLTMELKSAVTDGEMAYVCFGITAPEDVVLNETRIDGYSPMKPTLLTDSFRSNFMTDQNGNEFMGYRSIASVEDYDGLSNTQNLVIQLTADQQEAGSSAFGRDMTWNMRFENLIAKYTNDAYFNELMTGKYSGQENFFFNEEESNLLYPEVTLAEGIWEFEIQFEEPDIRNLELIKEPVAIKVSRGWDGNGNDVYANVNITSFVLRSLSAVAYTDDASFAPDLTVEGDIYAVMNDGTKVRLLSESASVGEQKFKAELPIILNDVEYIHLPNGSKLLVTS